MERAAEKGKAIAAAVEGVEKSWGTNTSGKRGTARVSFIVCFLCYRILSVQYVDSFHVVPNTFIETLRDRMFRPSLSTIIPDDTK